VINDGGTVYGHGGGAIIQNAAPSIPSGSVDGGGYSGGDSVIQIAAPGIPSNGGISNCGISGGVDAGVGAAPGVGAGAGVGAAPGAGAAPAPAANIGGGGAAAGAGVDTGALAAAPAATGSSAAASGGGGGDSLAANMIGDSLIGGGVFTHQPPSGASTASAVALSSFHTFKIAENENVLPQDRIYFSYNSFNNVPGTDTLDRWVVGGEHTFCDGAASIGVRVPVFFVDTEAPTALESPFAAPGQNGSVGDLAITLKGLMYRSDTCGLSAGLTVVTPTGPATIGGVDPFFTFLDVQHRGNIMPWVGGVVDVDGIPGEGGYLQTFVSLDQPFDTEDAPYLYADVAFGHRIPCDSGGLLKSWTPIVEGHWSNPLGNREQRFVVNARGLAAGQGLRQASVLAYRNQVNITGGCTFQLFNNDTLTLGMVVPTVGPKVFDFEVVAQYNVRRW